MSIHRNDDARNLRLESVGEDEYGGNDQIIWRTDEDEDLINPYEFDWGDADSDSFL